MLYLLGIALFFAAHVFALNRKHRQSVVARLGEGPYKGLFSLISLAGLLLVILGWQTFPNRYFYEPPVALKHLNFLLMLPALILIVAAYIPNNMRRRIRHPMLTGVKIWALGHIVANGDLRSMILFLSFLTFAVIDVIAVKRRQPQPPERARVSPVMDGLTIVVGIAAYFLILMLHGRLFGMPVHQYIGLG